MGVSRIVDGYLDSMTDLLHRPRRTTTHAILREGAEMRPLQTRKRPRPCTPAILNIDDPVLKHLLVATAIGDSQEFELLSFDELEALKETQGRLASRIDATRRRLLLESKVRDAAQSLCRLDVRKGQEVPSSDDFVSPHTNEYRSSQLRCEDLAQQLWQLEKRASETQIKILKHTAAVLHLNHGYQTSKTKDEDGTPNRTDAVPLGPSGHVRFSLDSPQHSRREAVDQVDRGFTSTPLIENIEKQLRELNRQLRSVMLESGPTNGPALEISPPTPTDSHHETMEEQTLTQLQRLTTGLEAVQAQQGRSARYVHENQEAIRESLRILNDDLHQLMVEASIPDEDYQQTVMGSNPDMQIQLDYLQRGLQRVRDRLTSTTSTLTATTPNPATIHQAKAEQYETVVTGLWEIIMTGEAEAQSPVSLGGQNSSVRRSRMGLSLDTNGDGVEPYSLSAFSSRIQRLYAHTGKLEQEKEILRRQIQQQRELSMQSEATKDTVVNKLTEELERVQLELHTAKTEAVNANREVASVIQRLDAVRRDETARELQRANDESSSMNGLIQRQEEILRLETELQQAQDQAERTRREMQGLMKASEDRIQHLQTELSAAAREKERLIASHGLLTQQIDEKVQQLETGQADLSQMEGVLVRLQTEATVARAELDGAFGQRGGGGVGGRAAVGGGNGASTLDPRLQQEMDGLARRNMSLLEEIAALRTVKQSESSSSRDLQQRVDRLQKELSETIDEYEVMTRQSIEFEKDREQLEGTIDGLRERCEAAESQLNDEKLKWIGTHQTAAVTAATVTTTAGGVNGEIGPADSTSTMVLRSEFRKMMKEMKAESLKTLKVCSEPTNTFSFDLLSLQRCWD